MEELATCPWGWPGAQHNHTIKPSTPQDKRAPPHTAPSLHGRYGVQPGLQARPTLLEVKDLSVAYGEIEAVRGVSFTIDEGAVVALLGSNGAGKSTTLRAISGLVAPRAGSILFDGKPITGLSPRSIVKLGVAHVPEGRRIFPGLTVRENIMLGASNGNASAATIRRAADAMFELFPAIKPFADALGWTLSGGQLQMVAVARGLMAKP